MIKPKHVVVALIVLALLAVAMVVYSLRTPPFNPSATLTVLGYDTTNRASYTLTKPEHDWDAPHTPEIIFSLGIPDASEHAQTNAGVLFARVQLKNTGTQPISFDSQSTVPQYSCLIKRQGTWSKCRYYYLTGAGMMLDIGEKVDFIVWLPHDVTEWQLCFHGESAGPRLRTAIRLYNHGLRNEFIGAMVCALPNGNSMWAELQSEVFTVTSGASAPQTNQIKVVR